MILFKIGWICDVVGKLLIASASAKVVLNYVKEQLTGSKLGEKIIPYIDGLVTLIASIDVTINKVASMFCGIIPQTYKVLSVDEALHNMNRASAALDELNKK